MLLRSRYWLAILVFLWHKKTSCVTSFEYNGPRRGTLIEIFCLNFLNAEYGNYDDGLSRFPRAKTLNTIRSMKTAVGERQFEISSQIQATRYYKGIQDCPAFLVYFLTFSYVSSSHSSMSSMSSSKGAQGWMQHNPPPGHSNSQMPR